jgi:hypothetical protein
MTHKQSKIIYSGKTPQTKCDVYHNPVGYIVYDAKTTQGGAWGTLCEECFNQHGVGLETGRGQKYEWNGKEMVKTAG